MAKITPFLWFDGQAEEAARFYVSVFRNSKVLRIARYGAAAAKASGRPEGSVMTVGFQLEGQYFTALNGGPVFRFNPAISLVVHCKDQKELDRIWDALAADPSAGQCGWLTDKYGVSWQLVPAALARMAADPRRGEPVMAAIMGMRKLDIATLERAYRGGRRR